MTATAERPPPLTPNTKAPDFCLHTTPEQTVSLNDFAGRPTVLAFYPADWSPVCTDQLVLYQELHDEFSKYHAQVLGISVDGVWCHLAFAKDRHLRFPLLADFEPKGAVSRAYQSYRDGDGYSERALFVIDPQGAVYWSYLSPVGVNPGADGILRALDDMAKKHGSARPQATR
jgi:peroxiredoxin